MSAAGVSEHKCVAARRRRRETGVELTVHPSTRGVELMATPCASIELAAHPSRRQRRAGRAELARAGDARRLRQGGAAVGVVLAEVAINMAEPTEQALRLDVVGALRSNPLPRAASRAGGGGAATVIMGPRASHPKNGPILQRKVRRTREQPRDRRRDGCYRRR